jgi:hypothetical protein
LQKEGLKKIDKGCLEKVLKKGKKEKKRVREKKV